MLVYQQKEFLLFVLQSFLCGVFLGAVYDCFRISRILVGITVRCHGSAERLYGISYPMIGKLCARPTVSKRTADVLIFVSDVLFSLIVSASVLVVTFFRNDGKIRAECLAITAAGFAVYYFSIGMLTALFSSYIAFVIRIVLAYVRFAVMLPLRLLYGILKKAFLCLYANISGRIRAYVISKESKKYTSYVVLMSRSAFLDLAPGKTKKGKGTSYGIEKKA